ncbi:MAG TPA: hypothetical protein VF971_00635 [Candidatus Limnocylindrales bacterium]|jgi:hypothetical protein
MTAPVATLRPALVRAVAAGLLRGGALIAIAMLLILVLLPAALGAAGPQVPIVG